MGEDDAYSGILGAYRYAFRVGDSRLFRVYVLLSALLGGYIGVLVLLGVVRWLGGRAGLIGELALLPVLGILVLGPLVAPVLVAARRSRRGEPVPARRLAGLGFGFVFALLLGLAIADPNPHSGIVGVLDGLPWWVGLLPPIAVVAVMIETVRRSA